MIVQGVGNSYKHLYFILDWILVGKLNGTNVEKLPCYRHNEASKMNLPRIHV